MTSLAARLTPPTTATRARITAARAARRRAGIRATAPAALAAAYARHAEQERTRTAHTNPTR